MRLNVRVLLPRHSGFTMLELIVVMILITILTVSVFSRFTGTVGYSEYTYQARLLSSLRNMQTRAMFDTRDDYCFQINLQTSPPAFGPPTLSYVSGNANDTCNTAIDFNNPDYLTTTDSEMTSAKVSLVTIADDTQTFSHMGFDDLGRPITNGPTCDSNCRIELTGKETAAVCVESQGYIHACE